jgi:replication factor C subunit 2/4
MSLWVEKYRPRSLDEISSQQESVKILDQSANVFPLTQLPHLLFYGPPGTGKTSTILALCHKLYGTSKQYLELNASDERGSIN